MSGDHTYREILEQPAVWQRVLDGLQPDLEALGTLLDGVEEVVLTGCGSSYYLALTAAPLFCRAGARAKAVPASELLIAPEAILHAGDRVALVALSRSGETSETLEALRVFKDMRAKGRIDGPAIGFSCTPSSSLVLESDRAVTVPAQESSLVMTQSFTGMLLALQLWAALLDPSPAGLEELSCLDAAAQTILDSAPLLKEVATFAELHEVVLLGHGPFYGLAREGALKLQEMAGERSVSALHTLELRHGPKTLIGPQTLAIFLRSDAAGEREAALIREVKMLGAKTLVFAAEPDAASAPYVDYHFSAGRYSDAVRSLLYAPWLQLLGYHRAMMRGLDPDQPRHLQRAVIL